MNVTYISKLFPASDYGWAKAQAIRNLRQNGVTGSITFMEDEQHNCGLKEVWMKITAYGEAP